MARGASNLSVGTKGWADRINAAWRQSASEIVNAGRILLEAKASVPHGDFERMLKRELDFDQSMAQRLMAIASDNRITNPANLLLLPRAYTTLYELTKLPDDEFNQALSAGTIHPKMHRADVPKKRKETPQGAAVLTEGGSEFSRSLAAAEPLSPQDDREGEDSGVTEEGLHMAYRDDEIGTAEPVADFSALMARSRYDPTGRVTFTVGLDPTGRFASGLLMAMAASRELVPSGAARTFPADMPFRWDEFVAFCSWLHLFATEVSSLRFGSDNDQAPRAANAE